MLLVACVCVGYCCLWLICVDLCLLLFCGYVCECCWLVCLCLIIDCGSFVCYLVVCW